MTDERYHPSHTKYERASEFDADELTEIAFEQLMRHVDKIAYLVGELKEGIEEKRWKAILADDRGARILALIVREVIKIYVAKRDKGAETPKLFFVAGDKNKFGSEHRKDDTRAYAEQLKEDVSGRMLLLTNVTDSGGTILRTGRALRDAGVMYDVATLTDVSEYGYEKGDEKRRNMVINSFREDAGAGSVYTATAAMLPRRPKMPSEEIIKDILQDTQSAELILSGGVEKNTDYRKAVSTRDPSVPQKSIGEMRAVARMVAEDIYKNIFEE